jgi:hypothetical protein
VLQWVIQQLEQRLAERSDWVPEHWSVINCRDKNKLSTANSSRSTKIKPKFSVSDNRLISLSVGRNTRFQFPLPDVSRPALRSGQFSGTEKQFVRATTLARQAHDQLALTLTASSLRMNPGGRPCLERISSQPSLESTTFSRTPFAILATSAESSVGSLKTWVARTV